MEESCSKVIDCLLKVQDQIRSGIPNRPKVENPAFDWVSVEAGCSQCESFQASLDNYVRKFDELTSQIEFATGVLLQMHDSLQPHCKPTINHRRTDLGIPTPVARLSSPLIREPRSLPHLPANLIATIIELASQEDPTAALKFSCVDRTFRRIVLSNPQLWSRISLRALQPTALQIYLERSRQRGLAVLLTSWADLTIDNEVEGWGTILGVHTQRITSLAIRAPGCVSFALISSIIDRWRLPSLLRVQLEMSESFSAADQSKPLFRWDALDPSFTSIESLGDTMERFEAAVTLLKRLESSEESTTDSMRHISAAKPISKRTREEDTSEILAGSMKRLKMESPSRSLPQTVELELEAPAPSAPEGPALTPKPVASKKPESGLTPPTIAVADLSGSTALRVTGVDRSSPPVSGSKNLLNAGRDAMETDTVGPQASIVVWGKPSAVSADKTCSNKPHDLEDDDADDPLMVSEYASEIFEYLRKLEATILPDPDYMKMQPELTWSTRGTLADWMLALHNSLKLLPETYWLAMNLLDRFLSRRSVALAKFQLLGVACHMAAAKYTEILAPTARQWVTSSDGSFTKRTLILAERYILKVLEFKVGSPNPLDFLRRISKVDDYDAQLRALAKFLALIQCFTPGLLGIPPSLLAASAYWLARVCLERFNWTDKHVEYSGYNEDQLIPHAQAMIAYLLEPVEHESLHRIWSWKKNFKAATFLRDWATKNWSRPEPGSKAVILPIDIKLGLLRMKTGAVNEPDNDHP